MIGRLRDTLSRLFFLRRMDMSTITYVRPTGTTITVHDVPEMRAYATENGWVEAGTKPAPKAPKKEKPHK